MTAPPELPSTDFKHRLERISASLRRLDARSAALANLRTVTFLSGLALLLLAIFERVGSWGLYGSGAALGLYVWFARRHDRVLAEEVRERQRARLCERGLARLEQGWHEFPETGVRYLTAAHPYAGDLDLFGPGSLFQLLDETATLDGEATVARWLSEPAPIEEVRARQRAVAELAPKLDFRLTLIAESRVASAGKTSPAQFIAWAEGDAPLAAVAWARHLPFVLPPLTLALYLLGDQGLLPRPLFWLGLLAQLLVVVLTRRSLGAYFDGISTGEGRFVRFERTFEAIERERFEDARLKDLQAGLEQGGPRVSQRFLHFGRLFGFAELRRSGQLHAVINLLLLWDLIWLFRLERWRVREGAHVRRWFEALASLEALSSFATLAHARPEFRFPSFEEGPLRFEAQDLGHPLLAAPVLNDVRLGRPGAALLVTGSNMSGKTTLLRAIGINAVMAQCGLPVCARALSLTPSRVVTSMRVKDSLERGVSYFYAEVQRMKLVLDTCREGPAMFLLDEILMGTNTRERQIASRELVRLLLGTGAIGAITTHDLALTELAAEPGLHVRNVHFRDALDERGDMTFDYRMKEGVVETSNALRLLVAAGVPISSA